MRRLESGRILPSAHRKDTNIRKRRNAAEVKIEKCSQ